MASELLEGSCLCGKCRYAISANLMHFFHCHCLQCRKTTSSSFAANIIAEPAEIQWVSGADNIKRFDYPDRDRWNYNINAALDAFARGDAHKIVLARKVTVDADRDMDPTQILRMLQKVKKCSASVKHVTN